MAVSLRPRAMLFTWCGRKFVEMLDDVVVLQQVQPFDHRVVAQQAQVVRTQLLLQREFFYGWKRVRRRAYCQQQRSHSGGTGRGERREPEHPTPAPAKMTRVQLAPQLAAIRDPFRLWQLLDADRHFLPSGQKRSCLSATRGASHQMQAHRLRLVRTKLSPDIRNERGLGMDVHLHWSLFSSFLSAASPR